LKSHTARCIFWAAIALGVIADRLFYGQIIGINLLILLTISLAVSELILWDSTIPMRRESRFLIWSATLFAAAISWRDSPVLTTLNLAAIFVILMLVVQRRHNGAFLRSPVTEYLFAMVPVTLESVIGFIPLVRKEINWAESSHERRNYYVLTLARGLLIATPLVLVFGSLFYSADSQFSALVRHLFDWDFADILSNLLWTLFCAAVAAGCIRVLLIWDNNRMDQIKPDCASLGKVELFIVIGLMNILFFTFVMIQFRFLFGSHDLVQMTPGLTYTQYARSGFFELVWVTLLVLPTLLILDWLFANYTRIQLIVFRSLTCALVIQLFVIMLSALHRMQLYVVSFGLTELRLYVTVFMAWLAIVFVWFLVTVLRGRRDRFAFGAFFAALAVILGLNVINPDSMIVRYNRSRLQNAAALDTSYLEGLSADAVPDLVQLAKSMADTNKRQSLTTYLAATYVPNSHLDWRSWNWSRDQAIRSTSRISTTNATEK